MTPMFYEKFLRRLVDAGSRFLIVGGVAVNLHGIPRMTADPDLLIDLDPAMSRGPSFWSMPL